MAYDKSRMIVLSDYGLSRDKIDLIYSKLDTKVKGNEERLQIVNSIFEEYAEEFLNLTEKNIHNLNSCDTLSENTAIIAFFDRFTNYIDNSEDARADRNAMRKGDSKEIGYTQEALLEVKEMKKGYYLPKDQKIFPEDFKNEVYGSILNDYEVAIQSMSMNQKAIKEELKEMEFGTKEYKAKSRLASKIGAKIGAYKTDQLDVKNILGGLITFNKLCSNSSGDEWFRFVDYGNPKDVKVCLVNCHGSLNSEKGIISYDLDNLIKKCNFTDEELEILRHYRAGQLQTVIAKELELSQQLVYSKLDTMCNRISKQHLEDKYDNLRLNYIKGSYKKCSVCNEIKFEKEFYPNRNVCKPCFNGKK